MEIPIELKISSRGLNVSNNITFMTIVSKCSVLMSLLAMNITQILVLLIVKGGKTFRIYHDNV